MVYILDMVKSWSCGKYEFGKERWWTTALLQPPARLLCRYDAPFLDHWLKRGTQKGLSLRFVCICICVCLPACLSACLPACLPNYLPNYLTLCLSACLPELLCWTLDGGHWLFDLWISLLQYHYIVGSPTWKDTFINLGHSRSYAKYHDRAISKLGE